MTPEEAIRKVRACRDDHRCSSEEACFTLLKFAERRLQLDILEEEPPDADELHYYGVPTLGI